MFTGGTAATAAVAAEEAELENAFEAVTTTRNVDPTSAEVAVYVCAVAPAMSEHGLPPAPQRLHWYAYESGCVPDQLPGSAVSVCPSRGVPLIVGGEVFAGGTSVVVSITSCGATEDPASRVSSDIPVVLVEVNATLSRPFPPTRDVTSTATHWPDANEPEEPVIVELGGGAFA